MKKTLIIANFIAFVLTVGINYVSNTGILNGKTIKDISDTYHTLFTPSGWAFSIWGLIYLLLLGFVVYSARGCNIDSPKYDFIERTGWWFVISCIANSAWIVSWLYEWTGVATILIFVLLYSLIQIVFRNRMELDDEPFDKILFLWWPFVIYSGWITVASIASTSSYLVKIGWDGFGIAPETWTIIMIIVAGLINLWITKTRNMREFAIVGAWALAAIASANKGLHDDIYYTAIIVAVILFLNSSFHAFRNWDTNPFEKFLQYRSAKGSE